MQKLATSSFRRARGGPQIRMFGVNSSDDLKQAKALGGDARLRLFRFAVVGFSVCWFAGCSTVDPLTMDRTARDEEVYADNTGDQIPEEARTVCVISQVVNHERSKETYHTEFTERAVEEASMNAFSNLGWFRASKLSVDARKALQEIEHGEAKNVKIGSDYVLQTRTSVAYVAKWSWLWWQRMTSHSKKARGVKLETEFRLIDAVSHELVIGAKFRTEKDCGKGDVRSAISDAAKENVRMFARIISARYLPPGRVVETRGGGHCAKVSIGINNMLLAEGKGRPATRVDFFEYVKHPGSERPEKTIVAHGKVISSEKNDAWIEVDADWISRTTHLATYAVKRGHYVKISETSVDNETE